MAQADIRRKFMELRDMCRNPKSEVIEGTTFSRNNEYERLGDLMEESGYLDYDYSEHLKGKNGGDMISNAGRLTFKECCTAITYMLRLEHWSTGSFVEYLMGGDVYKLLKRLCEVMP